MRLKRILILAVLGAIATGLYYYYGGKRAPLGQPPLEELSAANFSSLQKQFNDASDSTRVLVLMSPT